MINAGPDGKMDPQAADNYIAAHPLRELDANLAAAKRLNDLASIMRAEAALAGYRAAEQTLARAA